MRECFNPSNIKCHAVAHLETTLSSTSGWLQLPHRLEALLALSVEWRSQQQAISRLPVAGHCSHPCRLNTRRTESTL